MKSFFKHSLTRNRFLFTIVPIKNIKFDENSMNDIRKVTITMENRRGF
jgi:hypothetical protein